VKKNQKIIYKNFIQKEFLKQKNRKNFEILFSKIKKNILLNVNNSKNMFNTLNANFRLNFNSQDLRSFKKFKTIVIIGMGGSILGAEAIYTFLKKKIKKDFLFLDNIDHNKLKEIKNKKKLGQILFILISKSGNTIETLSNINVLKIVKKRSKNIIVISEKKQNHLYSLVKKMQLFYIEHRKYVGGRYSVLSEVGMVPAFLMGINILQLRKNLLGHLTGKNKNILKDNSIKLAKILENNKLNTIIFLNYIPELKSFLYWCQQLIAESLGKKGKGFLPVISPAPKDHHSLLQLYLDGPKNKLFYVFSKENDKKDKTKIEFLKNKKLSQIKIAQKDSFIKSLKKKGIPYREFKIKDFDEQSLGELFSYFMLETSIIGKLVNINPFDQPAVEEVKINTTKILL